MAECEEERGAGASPAKSDHFKDPFDQKRTESELKRKRIPTVY